MSGKSPQGISTEASDEDLASGIAQGTHETRDPGNPVGPVGSVNHDGETDLSIYPDALPDPVTDALSDLTGRAVDIDAAIRASLDSGQSPDSTRLERAEKLKRRFPQHTTDIDRTVWLDQLFDPEKAREPERSARSETKIDEVGPPLPSGRRRYRLIKPIGVGSNGRVYLAQDRLLSSEGAMARVAVKLLPAESGGGGGSGGVGEYGDLAIDEARRMRVVEHPNVVQVLDFGRTEDHRAFIVQEYIRGQHLGEWLDADESTRGTTEIVRVMAEVAQGVQAIHSAGLVHHDLKPQNVLIGTNGAVKVTDFGSSSGQHGAEDARPSGFAPGPGTLAFMAPERLRLFDVAPMPCSDVFSLGAILHWAMTKCAAAGDAPASALAALADPANDFSHLQAEHHRARIGRDLGLIIRRAVSTRIETRHPSAERFAQDLRDWLDHKSIGWTRPSAAHRIRLTLRRRPFAVTALALIVLSLGAAVLAGRAAYVQSMDAAESRRVADIERQRLETETAWKVKTGQSLRRLLVSFGSAKQHGLASEVLTSLWILEWSQGPLLLDDPSALRSIWQERIGVLERLRASLRQRGRADSVEARLIEPSLALWYIRDGQPEPALEVLDESLRYWDGICEAGDPWLEDIRALRALAIVLDERGSSRPPSSVTLSDNSSEKAIEILRDYQEAHSIGHEEPIRELVRETLDQIEH